MSRYADSAVSPVVGVMLMLVVTIIIAAVVSAFAGGMGSEQHKTPQVSLNAKSSIQNIQGTIDPDSYELTYPPGFSAANGLQFENTGGDTFSLNDIEIQVQTEDTKYTIRPTDTLPAKSILPTGISNGGYFQKLGNVSLSDRMIAPGDKFMLYADGCANGVTYTWDHSYYGPKISWRPTDSKAGFSIYLNKKAQYSVIDKISNRVIANGELILT
nr:type IV pilin N-terminal domain-containing protein [uncultured Methanoregula sp.]